MVEISINIPIPFQLTPSELVLEPHDENDERSLADLLRWLAREVPGSVDEEAEAERIFRSAVVLYQKLTRDGSKVEFRQCLSTAITWERG